ncbi:MAG: hypothetical protein FWF70_08225 [Bacteroidetes bacterium]|nr:hypothetical protein [Bacteroidota bacterium]MCL1968238.1 hypothetical protein [Bacteroidota bacterium]
MENQEKQGMKVIFSYENKSCVIRILNPKENIKFTLEKVREEARNMPDKLWVLPEMDNGGNRIKYYLGRMSEDGKSEILKEKNNGEEQSLFDYGVKEGDKLIIIKRVIAG